MIDSDTALTLSGIRALASRSTAIGGSAVRQPAEKLRDQLCSCPTPGPEQLDASVVYTAPAKARASDCCVATVAIDCDTSELQVRKLVCVDGYGVLISPTLALAQLKGGVAQGIGHVLRERIVYDEDGQLPTGSIMDDALPRADEMPLVEIQRWPTHPHQGESLGRQTAAYWSLGSDLRTSLSFPLTSESVRRSLQVTPCAMEIP